MQIKVLDDITTEALIARVLPLKALGWVCMGLMSVAFSPLKGDTRDTSEGANWWFSQTIVRECPTGIDE